jgi:hypothetical protein
MKNLSKRYESISRDAPHVRAVSAVVARAGNLLLTVAVWPGILAHEYAHYAACRLTGVTVISPPALRPFEDSAVLEHERVHAFGADLAIAVAPFVGNSVLAFLAFVLAGTPTTYVDAFWLWLGVCFAFTALPSVTDTETLSVTADGLPTPLAPVGRAVARGLRALTLSAWVAGPLTFCWTLALLSGSAALF